MILKEIICLLSIHLILPNLGKKSGGVFLSKGRQNFDREEMCLYPILCKNNPLYKEWSWQLCSDGLYWLILCFLTKWEQKRRKHTLAIMLQIIEMKNYKQNCFWHNSFLPRIEYQNVVSIFPLTCHKLSSRWRLRSWFRMWTRRVQVMMTITKIVRFINVLVILLKKLCKMGI